MDNKNIKRLFIGIPFCPYLPEHMEMIAQILKKLRTSADQKEMEIKWTPLKNLHLTLKFLGDAPTDKIPSIIERMSDVVRTQAPFKIKVQQIGAFPDDFHSRIIWLGCQNKKELLLLHDQIETELKDLGFAQETREFSPHITIGRLHKARSSRDLISPFVRKSFGQMEVSKLTIFESHLQQNHPIYIPLHAIPFGPRISQDSITYSNLNRKT